MWTVRGEQNNLLRRLHHIFVRWMPNFMDIDPFLRRTCHYHYEAMKRLSRQSRTDRRPTEADFSSTHFALVGRHGTEPREETRTIVLVD